MAEINVREAAVASFENALRKAGMTDGIDTNAEMSDKPMFWRDSVPSNGVAEALFLVYGIQNSTSRSADNGLFTLTPYIYGTVFTRNGRGDCEYQELLANIENACNEIVPHIVFELGAEDTDTSLDPDSPIDYINFTACQTRLA